MIDEYYRRELMVSYSKVFIGFVDLLGYDRVEKCLTKLGSSASEAILTNIFSFLDKLKNKYNNNYKHITWVRYGDSYICYSHNNDILHLEHMIENSCELIAFALNKTIPLRMGLTQDDINIDISDKGNSTVSGSGWTSLRKLEKCLDWMGVILYIPDYSQVQHSAINRLVQTNRLVVEQNHALDNQHFVPPFKPGESFDTRRAWFLNWYRLMRLSKDSQDATIDNWWQQIINDPQINDSEDVKCKQENSKVFADYCRQLRQAAYLIHFSGIDAKSVEGGNI
jgi:hypothetical protein